MDLTENKRAVDAFTYGAGTSGYPPQELLAALLTLDGASLTSGEVEELGFYEGWISEEQVHAIGEELEMTLYGKYLKCL